MRRLRDVPASFLLAIGDNWAVCLLLRLKLLAIGVFKRLFPQIVVEADHH